MHTQPMLAQKEVTPFTTSSMAVKFFVHSASCSATAAADSCTIGASSSEESEILARLLTLLAIGQDIEDQKRTRIVI